MMLIMIVGGIEIQAKNPRNSSTVKKEQNTARQRVKQTQQQIENNRKKLRSSINDLASVKADIETTSRRIKILNGQVASLDASIKSISDTISQLNEDIQRLRESTKASLRESRSRRQTMSATSMIFSSENFGQAMRRIGYLKELDRSRLKKTEALRENIALLDKKSAELATMRRKQESAIADLANQQTQLEADQKDMEVLIDQLKRQKGDLEKELTERQSQLHSLDSELERLIAEEQRLAEEEARRKAEEEARLAEQRRKEEEAALLAAQQQQAQAPQKSQKPKKDKQKPAKTTTQTPTTTSTEAQFPTQAAKPAATTQKPVGNFVDQKGKLPYPITGKYNVVGKFGRSQHVDFSRVEIDNPGIDIECESGTMAHAIFDGRVSSIFQLDGYHNIVMVRHGEYLTVYANIDKLSVKKGDTVTTGQDIGRIYADPDDRGRSILHFEVRKEREKLNPQEWLK